MRLPAISLVVACLSALVGLNESNNQRGTLKEMRQAFSAGMKDENGKIKLSNLPDEILLDVVPVLFGQKPSNLFGKFEQYKERAMKDATNDKIVFSDVETIVNRSGYEVEKHRVITEDNYVTTLYHLKNPLADRRKLKGPPIMLMHGGLIDPTSYLDESSIQHHPEKYPRTIEDGPITSWNRSHAFTLLNNGYDIWLVGTRGSHSGSKGRALSPGVKNLFQLERNMTLAEKVVKLKESFMYWHYSFDDIIAFEFPLQIEKVLNVTGAKKVSVLAYSYGTTIVLSVLGARPDIAKNKIHNLVVMAPFINFESSGFLPHMFCAVINRTPVELGINFLTRPMDTKLSHTLLPLMTILRPIRYSVVKLIANLLSGSSGQYRTFIESSQLGHSTQPIGFKQLKHACQYARAKQYQKYDYGFLLNRWIYGQFKPPVYNITNIFVKNWLLISAEFDNFGCQSSIRQILETVNPKPEHTQIPAYNHIDLITGMDVDTKVVLPVLKFFDRFALPRAEW